MAQFNNLVIRKPIPLHMLTGYPTEDRLSFLSALLDGTPAEERVGVIQSLSPLEQGQVLPSSHHLIETMETASCICCDVYLLFYGRLSRLLANPDVSRVVVDLEPRAEPRAMLQMLAASPLGLQLIPQRIMFAWNESEEQTPDWVRQLERRLWADAEIVLMRSSASMELTDERLPKGEKKLDFFVGSSQEQAHQFWQDLVEPNSASQPKPLSPMSMAIQRNKLSR